MKAVFEEVPFSVFSELAKEFDDAFDLNLYYEGSNYRGTLTIKNAPYGSGDTYKRIIKRFGELLAASN